MRHNLFKFSSGKLKLIKGMLTLSNHFCATAGLTFQMKISKLGNKS